MKEARFFSQQSEIYTVIRRDHFTSEGCHTARDIQPFRRHFHHKLMKKTAKVRK